MGAAVRAAAAAAVPDGGLVAVEVAGRQVALASVDGVVYAVDDTCTHAGCSLAGGALDGTVVTCPCHGSRFDVTSGALLRGPAQRPVQRYEARVEGEDVFVEV